MSKHKEQENVSGIYPLGLYVLVLPDKVEEKTSGGIILSQQTRENEQRDATRGTLVAVGQIAWKDFVGAEPWAQVGDYVLYTKYGINVHGKDGEDYTLLNDQDILALYHVVQGVK